MSGVFGFSIGRCRSVRVASVGERRSPVRVGGGGGVGLMMMVWVGHSARGTVGSMCSGLEATGQRIVLPLSTAAGVVSVAWRCVEEGLNAWSCAAAWAGISGSGRVTVGYGVDGSVGLMSSENLGRWTSIVRVRDLSGGSRKVGSRDGMLSAAWRVACSGLVLSTTWWMGVGREVLAVTFGLGVSNRVAVAARDGVRARVERIVEPVMVRSDKTARRVFLVDRSLGPGERFLRQRLADRAQEEREAYKHCLKLTFASISFTNILSVFKDRPGSTP